MTKKRNLIIDQGYDFSAGFSVNSFINTIANISGYTVQAKLKLNYSSADNTAISFTTSANSNTNIVTLSMNAATSTLISPGRYVYDAQLTSASNVKTKLVEGIVTVSPSVTR